MHPRARGMNLQCCTTTLNFGSAYAATRQPICASTSCRFPFCRQTPEVSIAGSRWTVAGESFFDNIFSYLSCLSLDGTLARCEVRSLTCRVEGCCSPLKVGFINLNPSKVEAHHLSSPSRSSLSHPGSLLPGLSVLGRDGIPGRRQNVSRRCIPVSAVDINRRNGCEGRHPY